MRLLRQALEGLHYINKAGFFHGNLKPTNLLLNSHDYVQLCDGFLLSLENPGIIPSVSSPEYLAPEMTSNDIPPGSGIDIYALGFTFLELMVGDSFQSLFSGIRNDACSDDMAWIGWHANKDCAYLCRPAIW